jgi:RNA polymerase sigma factor (sigma-70 family)
VRDVATKDVVVAARDGDQAAWRELVRRHAGLVWTVARSFRLSRQDIEDVSQTTWLLLAAHIRTLKDPAALSGWLATTARREGIRLAKRRGLETLVDPQDPGADRADADAVDGQDQVLRIELQERVRSAFLRLPVHCRRLLSLLIQDPPPSYAEVSATLGIPRGSIGPTRARCLARLREVIDP